MKIWKYLVATSPEPQPPYGGESINTFWDFDQQLRKLGYVGCGTRRFHEGGFEFFDELCPKCNSIMGRVARLNCVTDHYIEIEECDCSWKVVASLPGGAIGEKATLALNRLN